MLCEDDAAFAQCVHATARRARAVPTRGGGVMRESRFWTSPVLRSVVPVVEASKHVTVVEEAIGDVAAWMAYEEFAPIGAPTSTVTTTLQGRGSALDTDPTLVTNLTMLINTLNFAFSDFATGEKFTTRVDGVELVDSEAMVGCLRRAAAAGEPLLDGAWMANVTRGELARIFSGSIEMPLLDERARLLNEVGAVLVQRYEGSWRAWADSCAPSLYHQGDGLLERLAAEFPRFNDVSTWNGRQVEFMKLGQLGLWSLHLQLARVGVRVLDDAHLATAFADYIVPVALRVMGIMSVSRPLRDAIDAGREVPRDSAEEVELRALSIYAVARLTDEINARRPASAQLVTPQVDYRLWKAYHATHHPHHLTRTVMY
jgi:hypothetical protein